MDNLPEYSIVLSVRGGIDKYPAKAHARRIAEKLQSAKGTIILQGEQSAYFSNSDQKRPFRQDRYFYYLTGCNEPDCYVTYDLSDDRLTLWLPKVNWSRVFYDGRGSTPEEALEKYDIDDAKYIKEQDRTASSEHVVRACYKNTGQLFVLKWISDDLVPANASLDAEKLKPAMNACRAVKDEHEIALIRKANEISTKAHTAVLKQLGSLKTEAEAEALYVQTCMLNLAKEQSYGPIVGSGPNAAVLHYQSNDEPFGDRQLLLIDAGAEWQCYASDVTRTMPLRLGDHAGWPSAEAKTLYTAVENIQERCIKQLRPGKKFTDVAWYASLAAVDALLSLGILAGKHDEILKAGTWRAFFPHGLGHHMGLEVHDVPPPAPLSCQKRHETVSSHGDYSNFTRPVWADGNNLMSERCLSSCAACDPPLEPGMVITVEPGLYFNKEILEAFFLPHPVHSKFIVKNVLSRYMHLGGVRIEDDILITEDGYENLTTTPKGEAAIKTIRDSQVD